MLGVHLNKGVMISCIWPCGSKSKADVRENVQTACPVNDAEDGQDPCIIHYASANPVIPIAP